MPRSRNRGRRDCGRLGGAPQASHSLVSGAPFRHALRPWSVLRQFGALSAQIPLRLLIEQFGWRNVVLSSAAILLAVCGAVLLAVRNDPSEIGLPSYAPVALRNRPRPTMRGMFSGLREIFTYRNVWLIFLAQGGIVGPILAFTGLWGTPFLRARFGLPPAQAAAVCSVMIVCWAVASPLSGALSDRLGRRKPIYLAGALISATGWFVMFFAGGLPLWLFVASPRSPAWPAALSSSVSLMPKSPSQCSSWEPFRALSTSAT